MSRSRMLGMRQAHSLALGRLVCLDRGWSARNRRRVMRRMGSRGISVMRWLRVCRVGAVGCGGTWWVVGVPRSLRGRVVRPVINGLLRPVRFAMFGLARIRVRLRPIRIVGSRVQVGPVISVGRVGPLPCTFALAHLHLALLLESPVHIVGILVLPQLYGPLGVVLGRCPVLVPSTVR